MALDTTVGGAAANSYCSVEEADTYHGTRGANTEWTSADVPTKERYLQWAARELDARFHFIGRRKAGQDTQSLEWPRYLAWDRDGFLIDSDSIPLRLKQAQAEFAFRLMQEDWTAGLGSVVDEGVSIGPIRTSRERHNPIPSSVANLLSGLVRGGTGSIRSTEIGLG